MREIENCKFCGELLNIPGQKNMNFKDLYSLDCKYCKEYIITMRGIIRLDGINSKNPSQVSISCAKHMCNLVTSRLQIFHVKKEKDTIKEFVTRYCEGIPSHEGYDFCCIDDFENTTYEDHSEKPIRVLEIIANSMNKSSSYELISLSKIGQIQAGIVNDKEKIKILRYLILKKLLAPIGGTSDGDLLHGAYTMTMEGWKFLKDRRRLKKSNKVFIAMQFLWEDSVLNEKKRKEFLKTVKDACKDCGLEADIVSQNHTGNITEEIIASIKNSRFVIADLTFHNRGVYYEAGFARGLGIKVFHVVNETHFNEENDDEKRLHFDIQQIICKKWESNRLENFKKGLSDWIKNHM